MNIVRLEYVFEIYTVLDLDHARKLKFSSYTVYFNPLIIDEV